MRSTQHGFTLVEILVAVAIVAILAGAISPLVVKHIQSGRVARARSDADAIVTAIEAFQLDNGAWPVSSDGIVGGTEELSRLVGLPASELAPEAIPDGAGAQPGDSSWRDGGDGGAAAPLADLLIFNASDTVDPLYPTPTSPGAPGWRGPYLDRIPLDPWGYPYVCNVRYLVGANVSGVTLAESSQHAVLCLSAGANGLFETSFADATALDATPGGDDVGAVLQGHASRGASAGGGGGGGGACGIIGPEPVLTLMLARAWRRRRARRQSRTSGSPEDRG